MRKKPLFEKSGAKTFLNLVMALVYSTPMAQIQKSLFAFAGGQPFLFQKKKCLTAA
jgi:hypothetical protein